MIDDYTLYVDNFRGFTDTHIPILDVNFLVGENSSGKTSILSLLKLMSDERLLAEGQFLAEEVDLGTFADIASAEDNHKHFRIGMSRWDTVQGKRTPMAMLVTYEKYEGLPRDLCFSCTFENKELALRRVDNEVYFRTANIDLSASTDVRGMLSRWAQEHHRETVPGAFKRLDIKLADNQSLLFPLSLVAYNVNWKPDMPRHHTPC